MSGPWCAAGATCQPDMVTQELACEACGQEGELCCSDPEDAFKVGYCNASLYCNTREGLPNRCRVRAP
jgi:hypothetical protein